jgi:hypothetical protein
VHCATQGIIARPGAAKYTEFGTPLHHVKTKQKEKTYAIYIHIYIVYREKRVHTLESLYNLQFKESPNEIIEK